MMIIPVMYQIRFQSFGRINNLTIKKCKSTKRLVMSTKGIGIGM